MISAKSWVILISRFYCEPLSKQVGNIYAFQIALIMLPILGVVPYISTPTRYIFAERTPTPTVEPIRMAMEMAISYHGTVLMAILVNIDIGEVNGIYEHTTIKVLSTSPEPIEYITTIKAMMKSIVIGITEVLISSSREAVEPTAPNINA